MKNSFERFYLLKGEHHIVLKSSEDVLSFNFYYSIPKKHRYQMPFFLKVEGDFINYSIELDKDKVNQVIHFKLPALNKDNKFRIKIEYYVLSKEIKDEQLPKTSKFLSSGKIPEDIKKCLSSSKTIQSDTIMIKIASKVLKGISNDAVWFVKKVMFWTCYHGSVIVFMKTFMSKHPIFNKLFTADRYWLRLEDALSTLLFGGLCSGRANLQAALIRATKIPARIIITTPLYYGEKEWIDGQHYIVEFFLPEHGWIRSHSGQLYSHSEENIILKVVQPEDENLAGNGFSDYGGMVPWFYFDNKNIFFGISKEHMSYKYPESKKTGVPSAKGWGICNFKISEEDSTIFESITEETWDLFIKSTNEDKERFKEIHNDHEKSIELLSKLKIKEFIKDVNKIKNKYREIANKNNS
jgi:hypothetical protein